MMLFKKVSAIMIFSIFFLLLIINFTQAQTAVYLLSGKVTDKSGKPIGTQFRFITSSGKKIISFSNAQDGAYQQVFSPGETYYTFCKDYLAIEPVSFELPSLDKYTEKSQNFIVQKIEAGMNLMKIRAFDANSSSINETLFSKFKDLIHFLEMNPQVNLKIVVFTGDSKVKAPKKSKSKKAPAGSDDGLSELAKARTASIKSYFAQYNIPLAHTKFEEDLTPLPKATAAEKGNKKKQTNVKTAFVPNVAVIINRVLDL